MFGGLEDKIEKLLPKMFGFFVITKSMIDLKLAFETAPLIFLYASKSVVILL